MAKTLWLLRHFEAQADPPAGGRDRDRRLSSKGAGGAAVLGVALASGELGLSDPDRVLSSMAARTMATATAVFGERTMIVGDTRLYRATPDDVLELIHEVDDEVQSVAIVGHNPTIQCLSLDLVDEGSLHGAHPAAKRYPPGTLSVIELGIDCWSSAAFGEGVLVYHH